MTSLLRPKVTSRIRLSIAYQGTQYHGWQVQARKEAPALATIQAILEKLASRIAEAPVNVHASGRTDSGVHAEAQIAHMDVPLAQAHIDWQMALNHLLPHDIRIKDARIVSRDFHAQHSTVNKTYLYRLWLSRRYTPPCIAPYVWPCGPVDIMLMEEAIVHLTGTHDFSACKNMGTPLDHHIRTIHSITRTPPAHLDGEAFGKDTFAPNNEDALLWYFTANGFLKQMVRNLMGLLVAVGRGKIPPHRIPQIIASGDRQQAPSTAPAHGLTLWYVNYGTHDYTQID